MTASQIVSRRRRLILFFIGVLAGLAVLSGVVVGAGALLDSSQPPQSLGPPAFGEVTAGIDHVYDGEFEFFVGGGVAVFDCDGNRLPDLFLAGGERPAALYRNSSLVGGDLQFVKVTQPSTDVSGVTGAYPLDVDSDGYTDLAVLRVGENSMLRGLGDCRFEEANESWGIDGGNEWTVAFSATWETSQDLPTLAFGNYLALKDNGERSTECESHLILRPRDGSYTSPEQLEPGWCALSILFSDWGRNGTADLRITNDRHYYRDGEEQLWRLDEDGSARPYTRDDGWEQMQIWGMGIASHDVTGDGLPEVFLTSQGDNKLQTLGGSPDRPTYEDIALAAGANAHRPFQGDTDRPSTAWHAEFDDVNNDGHVDLFVTKGNVDAMPEFAQNDPNNLLLGQPDARFAEAAGEAGLIDFARSRGAALTDLNLDGLLDVVVVERREAVKIWMNAGAGEPGRPEQMGNWISIDLSQDAPNRDAIGAWIELRTNEFAASREITVGGGHAGGENGWVHFGLGEEEEAEVRVVWPDGQTGSWMSLAANRFWIIERGNDTATEWMQD